MVCSLFPGSIHTCIVVGVMPTYYNGCVFLYEHRFMLIYCDVCYTLFNLDSNGSVELLDGEKISALAILPQVSFMFLYAVIILPSTLFLVGLLLHTFGNFIHTQHIYMCVHEIPKCIYIYMYI